MPSWAEQSGKTTKHSWFIGTMLAVSLFGMPSAWAAALDNFSVGVNNAPGASTSVAVDGTTTVRITLTNAYDYDLTNVAFSGLAPNPATGNTLIKDGEGVISGDGCMGGSVIVSPPPNGAVIGLSGLTVPAKSKCYVDVPLKAVSETGALTSVEYELAKDAVNSDQGSNATGGKGSFNIEAVGRPTWSKGFGSSQHATAGASATAVLGDTDVTWLTFRVVNPSNGVALTGVTFEDVFPTFPTNGGKAIIEPLSSPASVYSNCGTSAAITPITGDAAKVMVTGVSVSKGGTCTISVPVKARHTGSSFELTSQQNTLKPDDFSSAQGLKPAAEAKANITVKSPLGVSKVANPQRVASGEIGTFVITLSNSSDSPLTITEFNEATIDDDGQSGQRLTPTGIDNTCGGNKDFSNTPGGGFSTSNYGVPANGSCKITVSFIGTTSGNTPLTFTNSIPQGVVKTGDGIVSEGVSAVVTLIDELFVDKTQSPSTVAPGNPVQYSVTVSNFSSSDKSNVTVEDALQNGATFLTDNYAGMDRSPTLTCGGTAASFAGTLPALGASAVAFVIPSLPAKGVANTPGQCTVSFWALTDPSGTDSTSNVIAECRCFSS